MVSRLPGLDSVNLPQIFLLTWLPILANLVTYISYLIKIFHDKLTFHICKKYAISLWNSNFTTAYAMLMKACMPQYTCSVMSSLLWRILNHCFCCIRTNFFVYIQLVGSNFFVVDVCVTALPNVVPISTHPIILKLGLLDRRYWTDIGLANPL